MSKITIESNFLTLGKKAEKRVGDAVQDVTSKALQAIKDSMAEPKSGRRYGSHVASAQGESPAIKSGELLDSLAVEVRGLTGEITAGTDHAVILELEMNRPFMTQNVLSMEGELTKEAGEAINRAVVESKI